MLTQKWLPYFQFVVQLFIITDGMQTLLFTFEIVQNYEKKNVAVVYQFVVKHVANSKVT